MLIILLNKATKLSSFFLTLDKEYIVGIRLGLITDTWDTEGRTLDTKEVPSFSLEHIKKTVAGFEGVQYQAPPIFSAIKHKGRPLYRYAREGKKVNIEKRRIMINYIQILDYSIKNLTIKVGCSSGTYVRWLAHALGEELGCGAVVQKLTRTSIGEYTIFDAIGSESIDDSLKDRVIPISRAIPRAEKIFIHDKYRLNIKNGHWLSKEMIDNKRTETDKIKPGDMIYLNSQKGNLLAVHRVEGKPPIFSKPVVII